MRTGTSVLLPQTLAEFASVAIRKARISVEDIQKTIDAWRAVLPIQVADQGDLSDALEIVKAHHLSFWDAMLWASAQRAGVRHLITEDMQDGLVLQAVTFVNPFKRGNDKVDRRDPALSLKTRCDCSRIRLSNAIAAETSNYSSVTFHSRASRCASASCEAVMFSAIVCLYLIAS